MIKKLISFSFLLILSLIIFFFGFIYFKLEDWNYFSILFFLILSFIFFEYFLFKKTVEKFNKKLYLYLPIILGLIVSLFTFISLFITGSLFGFGWGTQFLLVPIILILLIFYGYIRLFILHFSIIKNIQFKKEYNLVLIGVIFISFFILGFISILIKYLVIFISILLLLLPRENISFMFKYLEINFNKIIVFFIIFILAISSLYIFEYQTKKQYSSFTNLNFDDYWTKIAIKNDDISKCSFTNYKYFCVENFFKDKKPKFLLNKKYFDIFDKYNKKYCKNNKLKLEKYTSCKKLLFESFSILLIEEMKNKITYNNFKVFVDYDIGIIFSKNNTLDLSKKYKLIVKNMFNKKLVLDSINFQSKFQNSTILYLKSNDYNTNSELITLKNKLLSENLNKIDLKNKNLKIKNLNLSDFKFTYVVNSYRQDLILSMNWNSFLKNSSYFFKIFNEILVPQLTPKTLSKNELVKIDNLRVEKLRNLYFNKINNSTQNILQFYENESFWIKPEKINDPYGLNKKNLIILSIKNNYNKNISILDNGQLWLKDNYLNTSIFCPLRLIDSIDKLNFPSNNYNLEPNKKYKLIFACRFKNLKLNSIYLTVQPFRFKVKNHNNLEFTLNFKYNSIGTISSLGYFNFFN